jgi:RNA polymerase primary sigma factor
MDFYLKEIRKFPPFSKEEEREVILKAKNGDRKAYEELMHRNLRFVVSIAKRYQNQGVALEDLIEEGNIGLLTAFDRFDTTRNVKFITYAVWWIRQGILKSIHENSNTIKLPLNIIIKMAKFNKVRTELEQELGRTATMEDMLEVIDDELLDVLQYSYGIVDLHAPRTENDKDLSHILPNENILDLQVEFEDVKDELGYILEDFTDREREILLMYFGIEKFRPYTLKEIGTDWGLTRERIRQIKEKTIEKLKDDKYANQLREYL